MNELQRTESSKQSDWTGVSLPGSYAPPTHGLGQGGGSPGVKRSERLREAGEDRVGRETSSCRRPGSPAPPLLSNSLLPPTLDEVLCPVVASGSV